MGRLSKYLSLALTVAMALPLGWCCPPPVAASEAAAKLPSRCPNCQPPAAPTGKQVPARPMSPEKCPCCQARAKTNVDQVVVAPVADLWIPLPAPIACEAPAAFDLSTAELIQFPGPPLQALHCVWRC